MASVMSNDTAHINLPHTVCVTLILAHRVGHEPVGGIHVYILSLLHRLGIIRVPTEYRESEAW